MEHGGINVRKSFLADAETVKMVMDILLNVLGKMQKYLCLVNLIIK